MTYGNINYACFASKNVRRMHPPMHPATNAFLRRHIEQKTDCIEERCRIHRNVVLITVLMRKVICVLLFDTYNKDKIELSLRHYYKKNLPHGGILRTPVCVILACPAELFEREF